MPAPGMPFFLPHAPAVGPGPGVPAFSLVQGSGEMELVFPAIGTLQNKKFIFSAWIIADNTSSSIISGIQMFDDVDTNQLNFKWRNTDLFFDHAVSQGAPYFDTNVRFDSGGLGSSSPNWTHIFMKCDTPQGTNTDRLQIYRNGVQQNNRFNSYPAQDDLLYSGFVNGRHTFGEFGNIQWYDVHFIESDAIDGITVDDFITGIDGSPVAYNGPWGTYGYNLRFEESGTGGGGDGSDLGKDSSGNGQHWNITTAGTMTQQASTPDNP